MPSISSMKEHVKNHMNAMPEANKALFKMMNKPPALDNNSAMLVSIDDMVDGMPDEIITKVFDSMNIIRTVIMNEEEWE